MTAANAGYAYDRSVTGKGVTIAIVDTGIDVDGAEFAGRISPDSTGFDQQIARCATCGPETVRFGVDDVIGHGTEVASVAAAARNDTGVHGVAYDAIILALKISAPDLSNVTAGSATPIPESDNANAALIAPAIRYAVDKGAFVVTLAVNGTSGGQTAADQRAAMDVVRQNDRLVVESVSNFTGEDSFTGQIAEALVGSDMTNRDWLLFAIGVDATGVPRTANGNAGPLADRMLAAAGNRVQVVNKDGGLSTVTGNSFAAPAVAGAAALLKQYWPQLGGKAIARILLDTATDVGTPGVDAVFGVGLLNVEKAMQPQASTQAFDAASAVLGRYASLSLSAPFGGGGGLERVVGRMTVLDRYGRDFIMANSSAVGSRSSELLAGVMMTQPTEPWAPVPMNQALALTASSSNDNRRSAYDRRRPMSFVFAPATGQTVSFAANTSLDATNGAIAGSMLRSAMTSVVGTTAVWSGAAWRAGFSSGRSRSDRSSLMSGEFVSPLGIGLQIAELRERGQMLGARGGPAFGIEGATTRLTTLTAFRRLFGIDLSARAMVGRTDVRGASELLRFDGPLTSTAFAFDAARTVAGGVMRFGVSSPLRVQSARAIVIAPVAYDLATMALTTKRRTIDLAPSARETDLELGWTMPLASSSWLRLGVAHAFDAGHVAGARDTAGFVTIAIR